MEYFHRYGFFKILTVTLPLFCLLITWAASTATTTAGPPSSVQAAAEILRTRGYTLLASTLMSVATSNSNFSGTVLAAPDFAFSVAAAKFSPNRRVPQSPSASILLFHTLREPLNWSNLSALVDWSELPTLLDGNCLFVKNSGGEVAISTTRKPVLAVRIRQADIYADDRLVVHEIDGVLDHTLASKCSAPKDRAPPVQSPLVDRKVLDHAIRVIRRRGFTVVAAGLSIKRSELLRLETVSLFAPSDRVFFSRNGGFSFDFRRHVLPQRHRFEDLARCPPNITIFQTLVENMTMTVDSVDGSVTVNGVHVNSTEVYQNRWIVVFSISSSLDDAGYAEPVPQPPPPPPSVALQYPPPSHSVNPPPPASIDFPKAETPPPPPPPSAAPQYPPHSHSVNRPPPASIDFPKAETPPPPTATTEVHGSQCRISDFPAEIEGGDLLCPVPARTLLEEEEGEASTAESADEHVAQSNPLDEDQMPYVALSAFEDVTTIPSEEGDDDQMRARTLKDQVNIADDLFFYS